MNRANYVIFHPDYARQSVKVSARTIENGKLKTDWKGKIWVDEIRKGNEDPFVFQDNWLFSYCHASQLRKKPSNCYLQEGAWLIFCSGNAANYGLLKVDTVFEIGKVHLWKRNGDLELPVAFRDHMNNSKSELWRRHFKFPFHGIHKGVTHTYEAKIGDTNSFLPITNYERTQIDFKELPKELKRKISDKVWGKYPVLIDDYEAKILINKLKEKSEILVLGKIKEE
jgi:hypothetical protein